MSDIRAILFTFFALVSSAILADDSVQFPAVTDVDEAHVTEAISGQDLAFAKAVREDDIQSVKALIAAGVNVDMAGSDGWTGLIFASMTGRQELARVLLSADANPNSAAKDNLTPLLAAVGGSHAAIVKQLVESGADIDRPIAAGLSPLMVAIKNGSANMVGVLVDLGADLAHRAKDGSTPLITAAKSGHLEHVTVLVEGGANPSGKGSKGVTPLMAAVHSGEQEIVEALLKAGADPTARAENGLSALDIAVQRKHGELEKLIFASLPERLHVAAARGYIEFIKTLTLSKKQLNAANVRRLSPLMMAAIYHQTKTAVYLIEQNADVNAKDKLGNTPLIAAALNGDVALTKALIAAKADHNIRNLAGLSAYNVADLKGHVSLREILLELSPKTVEREQELSKEDRIVIQYGLNEANTDAGVPDGVFGKKTRVAITRYQAASNELQTGYLTPSQVEALMETGGVSRKTAKVAAANRAIQQAERRRVRLETQARNEANKRRIIFNIKSIYKYTVYLSFHSKTRTGHVWPGNNRSWVLRDSKRHRYSLSCVPGEKICYGAYSGKSIWGAGRNGTSFCKRCCWRCGRENVRFTIR